MLLKKLTLALLMLPVSATAAPRLTQSASVVQTAAPAAITVNKAKPKAKAIAESPLAAAHKVILTEVDIYQYAKILNFSDPRLLVALAKVESSMKPYALQYGQGRAHYGLLQISYDTARGVGFRGKPEDLYNWKTNMKYSAKYLEWLSHRTRGKRELVASYNAGSVFYSKKKGQAGHLVNQGYVRKVMENYWSLDESVLTANQR